MKKLSTIITILISICLTAVAVHADTETITIIERPGYFETHGDVFDISPGKYRILVKNMSGKDAGFVFNKGQNNIDTDKTSLKVILLKNGEQKDFMLKLTRGSFTYFCPIIPTPPYPLRVK